LAKRATTADYETGVASARPWKKAHLGRGVERLVAKQNKKNKKVEISEERPNFGRETKSRVRGDCGGISKTEKPPVCDPGFILVIIRLLIRVTLGQNLR
jgi:hypothetical protein